MAILRKSITISLTTLCMVTALATAGHAAPIATDSDASDLIVHWLQDSNAHLGSESEFLTVANAQLNLAKAHQAVVERQVADIQRQLGVERSQVVPIVRYHYEHGPEAWLWLSLLVSSKDWQEIQSNVADMLEVLSIRDHILKKYAADYQQAVGLDLTAQSLVEDLQIVEENLKAEQAFYRLVVGQSFESSDTLASSMSIMTHQLQRTWDSNIAPYMGDMLQQLDAAMNRLPASLPKQDQNLSLMHVHITIPQTILNQVVHQSSTLQNVQFLFRKNRVYLSASANGQQVLVMGHLSVENSGTRADYVVDEVAVDGILVDTNMAQQWLKQYAFYIDVSKISTHIRIQSVQVENQQLHLALQPTF